MTNNILKRANEIINERSEEKARQYGPISEGMERTARIASDMLGYEVTPQATYAVMIALKLARNATAYKQDNFLDACAYLGAWDNYEQENTPAKVAKKEFEKKLRDYADEGTNEEMQTWRATQDICFAKSRDVKMPTRGTAGSAGIDFYVPAKYSATRIEPGEAANISSGIYAKIPSGHALIAFNKSGVAKHMGLQVGACVVDEDYQGEIHLHVVNVSRKAVEIHAGMKLVQFLLMPITYGAVKYYEKPSDLYDEPTERGTGGFGSTGLD